MNNDMDNNLTKKISDLEKKINNNKLDIISTQCILGTLIVGLVGALIYRKIKIKLK